MKMLYRRLRTPGITLVVGSLPMLVFESASYKNRSLSAGRANTLAPHADADASAGNGTNRQRKCPLVRHTYFLFTIPLSRTGSPALLCKSARVTILLTRLSRCGASSASSPSSPQFPRDDVDQSHYTLQTNSTPTTNELLHRCLSNLLSSPLSHERSTALMDSSIA